MLSAKLTKNLTKCAQKQTPKHLAFVDSLITFKANVLEDMTNISIMMITKEGNSHTIIAIRKNFKQLEARIATHVFLYPETSVDIVNKNLVPKSNILINKRFPTRTSSKIFPHSQTNEGSEPDPSSFVLKMEILSYKNIYKLRVTILYT